MSVITVTDLEYERELDHAAMSAISGGGGAPWIYGWITPFSDRQQTLGGAVNIIDVTNNIYDVTNNITNNTVTVGQMVNQFQSVNVSNTGNGATLTVNPNSIAGNRAG
ncbi:hypothetical protein [Caballeronia ptereochthonis]|uniref:Uncharacterized protein n=1 Tax=Caballeronia ptereochthonis TaxID=1777144 RepID=A0A157ZLU1_9BURK|nr:hypothetical protein [Caballeronia ptereochthonis]SAK46478.1 hypothetical protein AWB83_00728 [Caballeronia ptereochthonis]